MIGKIVKGTYFRGVLDYLANKKQSKLIGGNMFGCDPKSLANEFALSRELNPRIKKIVNHVSLSLPIDETVNEKTWNKIAAEYIEKMGFKGSQYVIYRHSDRDHDHVHIVASRVRISDGSVVSDSWDYQRSQQIVRNLEQKYQLTPTQSSWEKDRSSVTREELEYLKKTGQSSVRVQLQETIDRLAPIAQTMPRLLAAIERSGIAYQIHSHKDGSIKGISYKLGEVNFPGYKLGKAYSFFGLQKYRNINYTYDKNAQINQVEALRLNSQSALNKLLKEQEIVSRAVVGVSTPSKQQFELERTYTAADSNTDSTENSDKKAAIQETVTLQNTPVFVIPQQKKKTKSRKLLLEILKIYGPQYLTGIDRSTLELLVDPAINSEISCLADIKPNIQDDRTHQSSIDKNNQQIKPGLSQTDIDEARSLARTMSARDLPWEKIDEENKSLQNESCLWQILWNSQQERLIFINTTKNLPVLIVKEEQVVLFSQDAANRQLAKKAATSVEKYLDNQRSQEIEQEIPRPLQQQKQSQLEL